MPITNINQLKDEIEIAIDEFEKLKGLKESYTRERAATTVKKADISNQETNCQQNYQNIINYLKHNKSRLSEIFREYFEAFKTPLLSELSRIIDNIDEIMESITTNKKAEQIITEEFVHLLKSGGSGRSSEVIEGKHFEYLIARPGRVTIKQKYLLARELAQKLCTNKSYNQYLNPNLAVNNKSPINWSIQCPWFLWLETKALAYPSDFTDREVRAYSETIIEGGLKPYELMGKPHTIKPFRHFELEAVQQAIINCYEELGKLKKVPSEGELAANAISRTLGYFGYYHTELRIQTIVQAAQANNQPALKYIVSGKSDIQRVVYFRALVEMAMSKNHIALTNILAAAYKVNGKIESPNEANVSIENSLLKSFKRRFKQYKGSDAKEIVNAITDIISTYKNSDLVEPIMASKYENLPFTYSQQYRSKKGKDTLKAMGEIIKRYNLKSLSLVAPLLALEQNDQSYRYPLDASEERTTGEKTLLIGLVVDTLHDEDHEERYHLVRRRGGYSSWEAKEYTPTISKRMEDVYNKLIDFIVSIKDVNYLNCEYDGKTALEHIAERLEYKLPKASRDNLLEAARILIDKGASCTPKLALSLLRRSKSTVQTTTFMKGTRGRLSDNELLELTRYEKFPTLFKIYLETLEVGKKEVVNNIIKTLIRRGKYGNARNTIEAVIESKEDLDSEVMKTSLRTAIQNNAFLLAGVIVEKTEGESLTSGTRAFLNKYKPKKRDKHYDVMRKRYDGLEAKICEGYKKHGIKEPQTTTGKLKKASARFFKTVRNKLKIPTGKKKKAPSRRSTKGR